MQEIRLGNLQLAKSWYINAYVTGFLFLGLEDMVAHLHGCLSIQLVSHNVRHVKCLWNMEYMPWCIDLITSRLFHHLVNNST